MIDYLRTLSLHYENVEAYSTGSKDDYDAIVWVSTVIGKADLDEAALDDYKQDKIDIFEKLAENDIQSGFKSSATGIPSFYAAGHNDQLNLIGAVTTQADMPYSCRPCTTGIQTVDVGGTITGTNSTGLANEAVSYDATISIDGEDITVNVLGSLAQTYDGLIAAIQIDLDTATNGSVISIVNGNLDITSASYGPTSTVLITDANLFSSLTQYVALNAAAVGEDETTVDKEYVWHTAAQLLTVINDGKDVKLGILQALATKNAQVNAAADQAAVDAITWE